MATLTKLNLPDDLMRSIERRASMGNISVDEQLVRDLLLADQQQFAPQESSLLEQIRKEREEMATKGAILTDEILHRARTRGRK